MIIYFDIETNGLYQDVTTVHCICLKGPTTAVEAFYNADLGNPQGTIENALERLSGATEIIGHNIIGFDLPVLEKLYGWRPNAGTKITDTLVMSYLFNPDRRKPSTATSSTGPHSLESWGCRVGKGKLQHETWHVFDTAMLQRCIEDVGITELTYLTLQEEARGYNWSKSLELEQKVAAIEADKERNGVNFNKEYANELINELDARIRDIDAELYPNLRCSISPRGSIVDKPFTVKGSLKKCVTDHLGCDASDPDRLVGGPFLRVEYKSVDLGSPQQIKEYLLKYENWKPDEWNYDKVTGERTSPKLSESSLESIEGDLGKLIKERIKCRHRKSQITGWVESLRRDNRITAGAIPCGTNTGRMRHILVANVPKAKPGIFYGTEMRSLFIESPGRRLVGHDAKGLELRMLAHYMDDPEFTEAVAYGDPHDFNQRKAGLPNRDAAKTFIYAFLYGAGDEKIGSIVRGTAADGADLRREFLSGLPKLARLISNVKSSSRKGYLKGLDGRKVWMRRDTDGKVMTSKALNTLLQSGGAIAMKQASVRLDEYKKRDDLDAWKVIDYHDEQVNDVYIPHIELFSNDAVLSVVQAGIDFNLRCPLDADVKVGSSWAEVH